MLSAVKINNPSKETYTIPAEFADTHLKQVEYDPRHLPHCSLLDRLPTCAGCIIGRVSYSKLGAVKGSSRMTDVCLILLLACAIS